MRFLADESCDFAVVRALRDAGHDVVAVCEEQPSLPDSAVLAWAEREARIVLTEDKDFGTLVYARLQDTAGVVLLRFPSADRERIGAAAQDCASQIAERMIGAFVVLEPTNTRVSRLPPRSKG